MNNKVESKQVDQETYLICQQLIFSGRLTSNERGWFLDNMKIEEPIKPPSDPNEVDKYGFFGPRNDNGCQQNVFVNKLLQSLSRSEDPIWRQIARNAPKYILFFSENYFPVPGTPIRKMMWWNRTKNFMVSRDKHYIHDLVDAFKYSVIPDHVCFTPGNFTNPDYMPELRDKYTGRLMEAYQIYLDGIYDKLTSRELGLGGRTS